MPFLLALETLDFLQVLFGIILLIVGATLLLLLAIAFGFTFLGKSGPFTRCRGGYILGVLVQEHQGCAPIFRVLVAALCEVVLEVAAKSLML